MSTKIVQIIERCNNPEVTRQAIMNGSFKHPEIDNTTPLYAQYDESPPGSGIYTFIVTVDACNPIKKVDVL